VLQDLLENLLPDDLAGQLITMDYGLHRVPNTMTPTLQEVIDSILEPSLVVLGYGLCGNGLRGLQARRHTLLAPRTDDCIALLLGSYRAYLQEFASVPGTYYLSKGWLESGSHPLSEYQEYAARYGPEQAAWLMDQQYQHYERLMLVAHTPEEIEAYRPVAQEVARYCRRWEMRYEERLGSDAYVRRLIALAEQLAQDGADASGVDKDFLLIPPGGEIRQESFMR
jgi:hypothetical protein